MPLRYVFIGLIVLGAIAGGIFISRQSENPPAGTEVVFAEYTAQTLEEYRGKPIVANSWAIWCPFCVKELADFAQVQREFGDDVVILAINRGESASAIQEYIDELDVADDLTFLADPSDSFYREALQGFSMPETIFIDREGNVQFHKRGPMDADEIRSIVQELL